MTSQTALVIFKGKSALSKMKCLSCRSGFREGDRVVVAETTDRNGTIAVAYHEAHAPELTVAQLYAHGGAK